MGPRVDAPSRMGLGAVDPRMIIGMNPVLAVVWHFWIAVALVAGAIGLVLAIGIMYLKKVEMPRYPRD